MRPRALLPAVLAGVALAAPAPAVAAPAVSVALERGPALRDCVTVPLLGRRCGNLGRRAVDVRWSAGCDAPATAEIQIELRRRRGPVAGDDDAVVEQLTPDALAGAARVAVDPGQRLYALARLTCSDEAPATETLARSAELPLSPFLLGYAIVENQICGFPNANLRRTLQARNWANVLWFPRFAGAGSILAAGDLQRVRLHARGAGIRVSSRPQRRIHRRFGQAGLRITPRRAGRVRIEASVDGLTSNRLSIRVLPPRRACAGGPER
jgi:hypothetical protein